MPHTQSAEKRLRQSEKRRLRNRTVKVRVRSQVKRFRAAADAGDRVRAAAEMRQACRLLDKAATKGVIHANQAARRKGRMADRLNKLPAAAATAP